MAHSVTGSVLSVVDSPSIVRSIRTGTETTVRRHERNDFPMLVAKPCVVLPPFEFFLLWHQMLGS